MNHQRLKMKGWKIDYCSISAYVNTPIAYKQWYVVDSYIRTPLILFILNLKIFVQKRTIGNGFMEIGARWFR